MRRLAPIAALAAAATLLVPGSASADDIAITAQLLGGRGITSALLTTPLPNIASGTSDGIITVVVNETNTPGDAAWQVDAELCEDVTCGEAQLLHDDGGDPIPGSAVSLLNRSTLHVPVLPVLDPDTDVTDPSGAQDLSTSRTLFSASGQNPGSNYTGVYTHTATLRLDPPAEAEPGTYTGVLRVTLVE